MPARLSSRVTLVCRFLQLDHHWKAAGRALAERRGRWCVRLRRRTARLGRDLRAAAPLFAPRRSAVPSPLGGDRSEDRPPALVRFCPHAPWPTQQRFLDLDCLEAFYGGAAAGGKSEALLMAALQYVHVPGYAALILRRDTQRLNLAGGLIPRSHEWLAGTGATWQAAPRRWTFPTGGRPATLTFGYLRDGTDKYRYGSSEFQYIAFDELTEFPEEDYLFLFSRLRRTTAIAAPLRMRSASNPGNLGHAWVKARFIDVGHVENVPHERAYIPARIADNPAVNEEEYRRSLAHLPPVYRERLMHGDWSIQAEGLIRPQWLRYFTLRDQRIELLAADGSVLTGFDERECQRMVTCDPAGTSADRAAEARGRPASWSVAQVWDWLPLDERPVLLLRHQWRERVGFDGLCAALREVTRAWRPRRVLIEREKLGQAACDVLGRELPIELADPGYADKVARAGELIAKLERGEVYLPRHDNGWRPVLEAEWLAWTGLAHETSDQIDAAAYAAREIGDSPTGPVRVGRVHWK